MHLGVELLQNLNEAEELQEFFRMYPAHGEDMQCNEATCA